MYINITDYNMVICFDHIVYMAEGYMFHIMCEIILCINIIYNLILNNFTNKPFILYILFIYTLANHYTLASRLIPSLFVML